MKINTFCFKNKFHLYKDKKKKLQKNWKNLLKIKYIQNNKKNNYYFKDVL